MPRFFEHYDRIRIVNLVDRADRRGNMYREIMKFHLYRHPSLAFFDAIVEDTAGPFRKVGSHGAFRSHLAILEAAAAADASVLILQDDCRFLGSVNHVLPSPGTDIFYGGWHATDPSDLVRSDIIGAHCMGFSARAAARAAAYLGSYTRSDFAVDEEAAAQPDYDPAIRPPIDGALVWFRRANPDLVVEFNKIAVQRSSPSDITAKPETMLSKVKRGLGY